MANESIGRAIAGRFRIVSRLAQGGMGETYRAWDLQASCPVVVKMPRRPVDDVDGKRAAQLASRFVREVEAMRALAHAHIVPIVDSGEDAGLPYVVMRFLPGGSLADHRKINSAGAFLPMPAGLMHFWLPAIAKALDFIHSKGVIHRDVKPANIFLDATRQAYLGDFGIAKPYLDSASLEKGATITGTQFVVGTPEYMAPELLAPGATPDGRIDQYALAITVYELLSGSRPFTGATAHIVVEQATLPVPPLDCTALAIPQSLTSAIEKALSKKPARRFESCGDFVKAALRDVHNLGVEEGLVRLLCPGCNHVLKAPVTASGRKGSCPHCRNDVVIAEGAAALWLSSEADALTQQPYLRSVFEATDFEVPVQRGETRLGERRSPQKRRRPKKRFLKSVVLSFASVVCAALFIGLLMSIRSDWSFDETLSSRPLGAGVRQSRVGGGLLAAASATAESRENVAASPADLPADARIREIPRLGGAAGTGPQRARGDELSHEIINSIGMSLRLIPAGTIAMGSQYSRVGGTPLHTVTISEPFFIGIHEVTNAQWQETRGQLPSRWIDSDHPVENVSWEDAQEFCRTLSALPRERQAGRVYRLPTQSEWEYACRSETVSEYSFGDEGSLLGDFGWYESNSAGRTHAVGKKLPNKWGLFDMHGNVSEWCVDGANAHSVGAVTDPVYISGDTNRILRGGSYNSPAVDCTSSHPDHAERSKGYDWRGFRVAMRVQNPRDLRFYPFQGEGQATVIEAAEMLDWLGAHQVTKPEPGAGQVKGRLATGVEVTIWPETYGRRGVYGVRFGDPASRYWNSNETYFEVIRTP